MNNSKTISVVYLAFLAAFALTGCNQATQPPAAGWYRLNVEKVVESDDLIIAKLNIEFAGEYSIAVVKPDGGCGSLASPDPNTGMTSCDVVLVADRMSFGKGENENQKLKMLVRTQSSGGSAGGPSTYHLKDDKPLKELFQLQIKSGEYAMRLEQEIASFRGEPLILHVGKNAMSALE